MMPAHDPDIDPSPVLAAARAGAFDRYIAALLAPAVARPDLMALAAFAAEISRVPTLVKEPMAGEIRLQWWRDAVATGPDNPQTGNPVADALRLAAHRHDLPIPLLHGLVDAVSDLLTGRDAFDRDQWRRHLFKTEGTLFDLSARIAGAPAGSSIAPAVEAAAEAYGFARALHGDAGLTIRLKTRGELDDLIKQAAAAHWRCAAALAPVSPALWPVFAPVALVSLYLDSLGEQGPDGRRDVVALPPVRRLWRLWRAARTGRFA